MKISISYANDSERKTLPYTDNSYKMGKRDG